MKKYIIQFISIAIIIGVLIYYVTSLITKTTFNNIFGEFEIILILIGFSIMISTTVVCTKIIVDKINKLRN